MVNSNSYIAVPVDAGGKFVRTAIRTVGANNVHEEFVIALPHERQCDNIYKYCSGQLVIGAAADGANVGRMYIENDPDSSVLIAVTKITVKSQLASALATPTAPMVVARRFTFTGNTPSGAALTGALLDSTMTAKDANWNVRTAATGMVITEAGDLAQFLIVAGATAVAYSPPSLSEIRQELDRPIILRAGEGIMMKQSVAGTTSDTRVFVVDVEIEQYTPIT